MPPHLIPDRVRRLWEERLKPPLERWEHFDGVRGFIQFVLPWIIAFKVWLLIFVGTLFLFVEVIASYFGWGVDAIRQDVALYSALGGLVVLIALAVAQRNYHPRLPDLLPASAATQAHGTVTMSEPVPFDGIAEATVLAPAKLNQQESMMEQADQGDYRLYFGVLWKIVRVSARNLNPMMMALEGLFSTRLDARGPYCPKDRALLRYSDADGDRYLMPDDDIGGTGGMLFCPTCKLETRPDPNYRGSRPLTLYRTEVERKIN